MSRISKWVQTDVAYTSTTKMKELEDDEEDGEVTGAYDAAPARR
jgi:hypothetical protein